MIRYVRLVGTATAITALFTRGVSTTTTTTTTGTSTSPRVTNPPVDTDELPLSSSGTTALANLPSLKLHVDLHRTAMALYGDTEFDVLATPVLSKDGTRVRYDGYASFVASHLCMTYALVGGAPYLMTNDSSSNAETVQCIPSCQLPFDDILPAVNRATSIPSASIGGNPIECAGGVLLKTSFGGIRYAICAKGREGFTAYASDVTIDVKYLKRAVVVPDMKLPNGSTCETVAKATALTPTGLALVTGSDVPKPRSRKLTAAAHLAMQGSSCSCQSTRRPCLFFHGLGNEVEEPGVLKSSRHFGWDKIQGHAPCCTSIEYVSLNTVDYAWTSSILQQKVCDRALSMSASSDASSRTIQDTILVTHSMGGLMLAGALANGRCHLAPSSTWVALSPPMIGSMASDHLVDYCKHEVQNLAVDMMFNGKCPVPKSTRSIVYATEKYSSKRLDAAYVAAQAAYRKHVYAAMCSSSYVGNISKFQFKYIMGGSMIPHKSSENDGLVEFASCAGGIPLSEFGKTPHDRFYRCELNHADTAFKTGDGLFKSTVRPVTWFECLL